MTAHFQDAQRLPFPFDGMFQVLTGSGDPFCRGWGERVFYPFQNNVLSP